MTTTKHTYSITNDVGAKKAHCLSLEQEIRDASFDSIFHWIQCKGDTITIWLRDEIDEDRKTKLNEVIHRHDGQPLRKGMYTKSGQLKVEVKEEFTKTGGHYQACAFNLTIDEGEEWQAREIVFPIPISLFCAQMSIAEDMDEDEGSLHIAPDTIIGVITSPVNIGDRYISVNETVVDNTDIGYWLFLTNMVQGFDMGRVTAIDAINNKIRMETPSEVAFMPGPTTPVFVLQTVKLVPYLKLRAGHHLELGRSRIGGSYVPPGRPIRINYKNNNGKKKTFSLTIEYLY